MSAVFWVTYGVQWLILAVLAILVILLYRQFGLMIMPGGKRVSYGGLDVGAKAPAVLLQLDGEREIAHDWAALSSASTAKATFAVFAFPSCPLCAELLKDHNGLAMAAHRYSSVQFLWIQGAREAGHEHEIPISVGWKSARSLNSAAHDAMEVPGSPFAYLIGSNGRILAKGLVNQASDIDELVVSVPAGDMDVDRAASSDSHQILESPLESRP